MLNERSNSVGRLLCGAVLSLTLVYCGGATEKGTTGNGGGGSSSSQNGPDAGSDVGPCGSNDECPSGSSCFYPIGSCDAVGQCIENSSGPECGAIETLCGCGGGAQVTTGCGYPEGYASGPTTGDQECGIAIPPSVPDAGDDAFFGGGHDVDGGLEGGTDVGPCDPSGGCPSGSACYYPIGNCGAAGECFENGSGPECGAIEILCGCNGQEAYSGCGYPTGYASAPATNSQDCGTTPPIFDGGAVDGQQ